MATSRFESHQYTSEAFVESAGAVLIRLSTQEVCVLHPLARDEYVLAKGRRNCGESRKDAAVREIMEETGFSCRLLRLDMSTRCPPAMEAEAGDHDDKARFCTGICEPFTLQLRHLGKSDVKLIWWYIAAVNEHEPSKQNAQDSEKFAVEFYTFTEVLKKLTFQHDRDLVQQAIDILTQSNNGNSEHIERTGAMTMGCYQTANSVTKQIAQNC
ncbi:MAG: hypothetical protein Q9222_005465 [Ikaeria aurantiellina]